MKYILSLIVVLFQCNVFMLAQSLSESPIKPLNIYVNGYGEKCSEYENIGKVEYIFSEKVSVREGMAFELYDDKGNLFDKSSSVSCDYIYGSSNYKITVLFNKAIKSYKLGTTYKIIAPANILYLTDNSNVQNEEIVKEVRIPDKISAFDTGFDKDIVDGKVVTWPIKSERGVSFLTCIELDPDYYCEDGSVILRKNVPIMKFPVKGAWDFNLGQTYVNFGQTLNFEKGVNYSFVLLENSVRSRHRDDLYNAEARRDFVGAYDRTFDPIEYQSCNVENETGIKQLGEVTVSYNTPVALAPDARLQLLDSDGNLIKEAVASISENAGEWVLSTDFGGINLDDDKNYLLVIPESTVVGTGSDITVNNRTLIPLNGYVLSVDNYKADETRVSRHGDILHINNVHPGAAIAIYSAEGTMRKRFKAEDANISMPIAHKGMLIVKVDGKAYKL